MDITKKFCTILALCVIMLSCDAKVQIDNQLYPNGTVVHMKSGGPDMIVVDSSVRDIACHWIDRWGVEQYGRFRTYELEAKR